MCRPKECSCAIWRPGCCHAHHVLVAKKSRSYAKASRISGIQLHKYSRMWSMWVALSDKRTIMHYTIYITWHLAVDAAAVSEKVGMATVLQTHAAFSKKVDAFAANTAASATQSIHILVPLIARWLGTEKPLHKLDLLQSTPCFALWTWTKWRNVTSNAREIMMSRTLRTWYQVQKDGNWCDGKTMENLRLRCGAIITYILFPASSLFLSFFFAPTFALPWLSFLPSQVIQLLGYPL